MPPRPIVRARQRSRTALPAFAETLDPQFGQIGIDRVQIAFRGTWHISNGGQDGMSASEFKALLFSKQSETDWFLQPENNPRNVRLRTRAKPRTTLSAVNINVTGWSGLNTATEHGGTIRAEISANPTRTLAHLLAEHGDASDFLTTIETLPVSRFFALSQTPITRAFGTPDNWVEDADLALRCLGVDAFSAFMPMFVAKLTMLAANLLSPRDNTPLTQDGADIVLTEPGVEVRLHFGSAQVPQIECYFERHHSQAVAGVRAAVAAALVSVNYATVARYEQLASHWIEREDDCLTIATKVASGRRLLIYAKSRRRIRFEIKRLTKGNYRDLSLPTEPGNRLLEIFAMERTTLLTICRWENVGRLFEEVPEPSISDLTRLCGLIATACRAEDADVGPIMARLLEDGGVSRSGGEGISTTLVDRLCENGVLIRTSLRRRDIALARQRVALKPEYRAVIDTIARALITRAV